VSDGNDDSAPLNYTEVFLHPLLQLALEYESKLRRTTEIATTPVYVEIVHGLLRSAVETYRVVLFLLHLPADSPVAAYPLQAAILSRTLIECIANLACLAEDPSSRGRLFMLDEYADAFRTLENMRSRFAGVPEFAEAFDAEQERLAGLARELQIPPSPPDDRWPRWPSIGRMLARNDQAGKPYLTGTRRTLVQELMDTYYSTASRKVHLKMDALFLASNFSDHLRPGRRRNEALDREIRRAALDETVVATLLFTCVLCETQWVGGFSDSYLPRLARRWAQLVSIAPEATGRVHALRYAEWIPLPAGAAHPGS
jgi:hypothetical protein